MFRYVALAWNPKNHQAAATARLFVQRLKASSADWCRTLDVPGLMVLHAGVRSGSSEAYVLPNGSGVVLGKLFDHEIDEAIVPRDVVLDADDASRILKSGGRTLIERYWGRYVAFIRDPDTTTMWVLRAPAGILPCYVTAFRDLRIFFSHTADCLVFGMPQFSINWQYVGAFLCYPTLRTRGTGLNEVSEVRPGECLEIEASGHARRRLYWDPIRIANSDPIESVDGAIEALRHVTKTCTSAWASCYPRLIHRLSGGLDSSIVLSCLSSAASQPTVTCLNYYWPSSREEDEREYARLAAEAAGCELVECEESAADVKLEVILDAAPSVNPLSYHYYARHSRFERLFAEERKATAIFTGGGGDNVFYQSPIGLAPADYVHRHGMRGDFLRIAMNVARRERRSLWSVLQGAIRDGVMWPQWNPLSEIGQYKTLIAPEAIEAAKQDPDLIFPLSAAVAGIPQGKLRHIQMMLVSPEFYNPLGTPDEPERVYPLLSQPLIELCLRIPVYVLASGGWDRAIARRAFAHDLPARIVSRRTKGGIDGCLQQLLHANLAFVRELLLDGFLVKEGLLDRQKLEHSLAAHRASLDGEAGELLGCYLSTEAWIRTWAAPRDRAAACGMN